MGIYQLIMIIALSIHIIDNLFSPKHEFEKIDSFGSFILALFAIIVRFLLKFPIA